MSIVSNKSIIGRLVDVNSDAITVDQVRCAKVRNRNVECLKCAQACTSGCISLEDGELRIDASKCVGCGTCATVCPTCALEARNPSDAELLNACLKAQRGDEVCICCSQLAHAAEAVIDTSAMAHVVCIGRVDESLLCELAAQGIRHVRLACGNCSACEQKFGQQTAEKVKETASEIFRVWDVDSHVSIEKCIPEYALNPDASIDDVRSRIERFFQASKACTPIMDVKKNGDEATSAADGEQQTDTGFEAAFPLPHVMEDGTLPHFIPDRRERLLNSMAEFGEASEPSISTRLWGCVVIDGTKCSSCRMCATFCPTGAIRKFDAEDGTIGVTHHPEDCVKCGSCHDICPEEAILLLDEVKTSFLTSGKSHRYIMNPRPVKLDDPHQILNTMKGKTEGDLFER